MARQIIDTTTNNGSYIGDPAKTAFEKTNANFLELYNFSATIVPVTGGAFTGAVNVNGEFKVGSIGNGAARVVAATGNVYWDSRSAYGDALPNATAFYRAMQHNWTDGAGNVRANLNSSGVMSAVSFNPTSTSDVKDNLEGYSEDASEVLDRLVVITYNYKPDFFESDKKYVGLLQENVKYVVPDAATDSCYVNGEDEEGNEVENFVPGNIDITQLLAISIRAHQQKNARIKNLEDKLFELTNRLENAGI